MKSRISVEEMKRHLKRTLKNKVRITTSLVFLFLITNMIQIPVNAESIEISAGRIKRKYVDANTNHGKGSVNLNPKPKNGSEDSDENEGDGSWVYSEMVGDYSVAVGFGAKTGVQVLNSKNLSKKSVAVGYHAAVFGGDEGVAIGPKAKVTAQKSVSIGASAETNNAFSVAVGNKAKTDNGAEATAIGNEAQTEGEKSVAIGTKSKVMADQFGLREAMGNDFERYKKENNPIAKNPTTGTFFTTKEEFAKYYMADKDYLIGKGQGPDKGDGTRLDSKHKAASQGVAVGSQAVATEQATSIGNDTYALGRSSIAIGNDDNTLYQNHISAYDYATYFKKLYDKLSTKESEFKYGFANAGKNEQINPGQFIREQERDGSSEDSHLDKRKYSPTLAAGHGSIAMGSRSLAYGSGSVAFGTLAFALKYGSTAIGSETRAEGVGAIAMGRRTSVFSDNSVSIGNNTTVLKDGGMAYGYRAYSGGEGSIAIGTEVYSNVDIDYTKQITANGSGGQKKFNIHDGDTDSNNWNSIYKFDLNGVANSAADNKELNSGNYFSNYNGTQKNYIDKLEDALTMSQVQGEGIHKYDKRYSLWTKTELKNGVKDTIKQSGKNSIVIGSLSAANGSNSLALGRGAFGRADNSFAIGSYSYALGNNSVALGVASRALSKNSLAFGTGAGVDTGSDYSFSIGIGAVVGKNSKNSLALGSQTRVNAESSMAIGHGASTTMQNSVALGVDSKTDYSKEDLAKLGWVPKGVLSVPTTEKIGVISVGKKGAERRIVNVASGYKDSDAANVGQLRALEDKLNQSGVLDLGENGIDNGVHYLSINKDGERTSKIKKIMEKQKDYLDYVEYKSKYLEAKAREARGDRLDSTYVSKLKSKVDQLEAKNITEISQSELKKINETDLTTNAKKDFDKEVEKISKAKNDDKYEKRNGKTTETLKNILTSDERKEIDESNFTNKGATGKDSIAIGYETKASGEKGIAIGTGDKRDVLKFDENVLKNDKNKQESQNKIIQDDTNVFTRAKQSAVAIGTGSMADDWSVAIGGNTNTGSTSVAIGDRAKAMGSKSISLGHRAVAGKYYEYNARLAAEITKKLFNPNDNSINYNIVGSVGYDNVDNAVAIGTKATATSNDSIAIGSEATTGDNTLKYLTIEDIKKILGKKDTDTLTINDIQLAANKLLTKDEIAKEKQKILDKYFNGKKESELDNEDRKYYNSYFGKYLKSVVKGGAENAIAIGNTSKAKKAHSIALGKATVTEGEAAVAIGKDAQAKGKDSVAFGPGAIVANDKTNGIAIGMGAKVEHNDSVAIGNGSVATKDEDASYLTNTANSGGRTFVIGTGSNKRRLKGLADGKDDSDAVTVAQLKKLQELGLTDNRKISIDADNTTLQNGQALGLGETLAIRGTKNGTPHSDGSIPKEEEGWNEGNGATAVRYVTDNIQTFAKVDNGKKTVLIGMKEKPKFKELTLNDTNKAGATLSATASGLSLNSKKLSGLSDGDISEASTDAITGKQLHTELAKKANAQDLAGYAKKDASNITSNDEQEKWVRAIGKGPSESDYTNFINNEFKNLKQDHQSKNNRSEKDKVKAKAYEKVEKELNQKLKIDRTRNGYVVSEDNAGNLIVKNDVGRFITEAAFNQYMKDFPLTFGGNDFNPRDKKIDKKLGEKITIEGERTAEEYTEITDTLTNYNQLLSIKEAMEKRNRQFKQEAQLQKAKEKIEKLTKFDSASGNINVKYAEKPLVGRGKTKEKYLQIQLAKNLKNIETVELNKNGSKITLGTDDKGNATITYNSTTNILATQEYINGKGIKFATDNEVGKQINLSETIDFSSKTGTDSNTAKTWDLGSASDKTHSTENVSTKFEEEGGKKRLFIGIKENPNFKSLKIDNEITLTKDKDSNNLVINSKKLTGLADGEISATSTDAITGKQLHNKLGEKANSTDLANYAMTDASNISGDNVQKWKTKLGITKGSVEEVEADTSRTITVTSTNTTDGKKFTVGLSDTYKGKIDNALDKTTASTTYAKVGLDNITDAGKKVIKDLITVQKDAYTDTTDENILDYTEENTSNGAVKTYKLGVKKSKVKEIAGEDFAKLDGTNLNGTKFNKDTWTNALGVNSITAGDITANGGNGHLVTEKAVKDYVGGQGIKFAADAQAGHLISLGGTIDFSSKTGADSNTAKTWDLGSGADKTHSTENVSTKFEEEDGKKHLFIGIKENPNFKSLKIDGDVTLSKTSDNNLSLNSKKLTGLADGSIAENSTDAVTGGQLHTKLAEKADQSSITNLTNTINNKLDKTELSITGDTYIKVNKAEDTHNYTLSLDTANLGKNIDLSNNSAITNLTTKVNKNETDLGSLTTRVTTNEGNITKLQNDYTTLNTKVDGNTTKITTIENNYAKKDASNITGNEATWRNKLEVYSKSEVETKVKAATEKVETANKDEVSVTSEDGKNGAGKTYKVGLAQAIKDKINGIGQGTITQNGDASQKTVTGKVVYNAIKNSKTTVETKDGEDIVTVTPTVDNGIGANKYTLSIDKEKVKALVNVEKKTYGGTEENILDYEKTDINGNSKTYTLGLKKSKLKEVVQEDFAKKDGSNLTGLTEDNKKAWATGIGASSISSTTTDTLVTDTAVKNYVEGQGFKISTDVQTNQEIKLGQTLEVLGKADNNLTPKTWKYDKNDVEEAKKAQYSTDNVSTHYEVNGDKRQLFIGIKENPNFKTLKLDDKVTLSVDSDDNLNIGSKKITGVQNGTADTDAVNYGQIKHLVSGAGISFKYKTSSGETEEDKKERDLNLANNTIDFKAGSNLTAKTTQGSVEYGLKSELTGITSIESKEDNSKPKSKITLGNDALKLSHGEGTLSLTEVKGTGADTTSKVRISNLADATSDHDAVNYKQLKALEGQLGLASIGLAADNNNNHELKLGERLEFVTNKTGEDASKATTFNIGTGTNKTTYSMKNIATKIEDVEYTDGNTTKHKKQVNFGISENPEFKSIKLGDNNKVTLTVDNSGNTTITKEGDTTSTTETIITDKTIGNQSISYKANSEDSSKTTTLTKGFHFTSDELDISTEADGKVKFAAKSSLSGKGKDGRDGKNGTDGAGKHGLTGKDGLNGKDNTDKVNALRNGEAGTVVYTNESGDRLVKANDGKYYKPSEVKDDGTVKTKDENGGKEVTAVDNPELRLVNANGDTTKATTLNNVASSLGMTKNISDNGNNEEYMTEAKNKVSELLSKKDGLDKGVNLKDLQALAKTGITFKGNDEKEIQTALGTELKIEGKKDEKYLTSDKNGKAKNSESYSSDNLITYNDNGTIRIGMKKVSDFSGINIGDISLIETDSKDSGKTLTLTSKGGEKVNLGGLKEKSLDEKDYATEGEAATRKEVKDVYDKLQETSNNLSNTKLAYKAGDETSNKEVALGTGLTFKALSGENTNSKFLTVSTENDGKVNFTLKTTDKIDYEHFNGLVEPDEYKNKNDALTTEKAVVDYVTENTEKILEEVEKTTKDKLGKVTLTLTTDDKDSSKDKKVNLKKDKIKYSNGINTTATIEQDSSKNLTTVKYDINSELKGITSISKDSSGNSAKLTLNDNDLTINNKKIKGLVDATLDENSTEAVTGKQLYKVKTQVESISKAGFINFAGNDGEDAKVSLGEKLSIIGEGNITPAQTAENNITVASDKENKKLTLKLAKHLTNMGSVTFKEGDKTTKISIDKSTGDLIINKNGDTTKSETIITNNTIGNQTISYKANSETDTSKHKTVKLSDGFDFTNGTNIAAEISDKGVVKYNLNKKLNGLESVEFINQATDYTGKKTETTTTLKTGADGRVHVITDRKITENGNTEVKGGSSILATTDDIKELSNNQAVGYAIKEGEEYKRVYKKGSNFYKKGTDGNLTKLGDEETQKIFLSALDEKGNIGRHMELSHLKNTLDGTTYTVKHLLEEQEKIENNGNSKTNHKLTQAATLRDLQEVAKAGLTFEANYGADENNKTKIISKKLGESIAITATGTSEGKYSETSGGITSNYTGDNLATYIRNGKMYIGMKEDSKFKSLTIGGTDFGTTQPAGKGKITADENSLKLSHDGASISIQKDGDKAKISGLKDNSVDDANYGTDGVAATQKEVKSVLDKTSAIQNGTSGTVVYTKKDGTRVVKENGTWYEADDSGKKKDSNTEVEEKDVILSVVNANGKVNEVTTLSNIKSALGLDKTTNGETEAQRTNILSKLTQQKGTNGYTENELNNATTLRDLQFIARTGLQFAGNQGTVRKAIGDTVKIVGGATLENKVITEANGTTPAVMDNGKTDFDKRFNSENVATMVEQDGTIRVGIAKDLKKVNSIESEADKTSNEKTTMALGKDGAEFKVQKDNTTNGTTTTEEIGATTKIGKDGIEITKKGGDKSKPQISIKSGNGSTGPSIDFETTTGADGKKVGKGSISGLKDLDDTSSDDMATNKKYVDDKVNKAKEEVEGKIDNITKDINKGLKFKANGGEEQTKKLGDTVGIVGKGQLKQNSDNGKSDFETNYNSSNVATIVNTDKNIEIGIAKELKGMKSFETEKDADGNSSNLNQKGLTTENSTSKSEVGADNIKITDKTNGSKKTVELTKDSITFKNKDGKDGIKIDNTNGTITGIKTGTTSDSAVNKGYVDDKIKSLEDNKPFEYFEKNKDGVFGKDGKLYEKDTVFSPDGTKAYKKGTVVSPDGKVYSEGTQVVNGKYFAKPANDDDKVTKAKDGKFYKESEIKDKKYDEKAKKWTDNAGKDLSKQPTEATEAKELSGDALTQLEQKPSVQNKLVRGKNNKFYSESDLKDKTYDESKKEYVDKSNSVVASKNPSDVVIKAMPNSEAMTLSNIGKGRIEKNSTDAINGGQLFDELEKKLNKDGSNIDQKTFAENASKGANFENPTNVLVTDKQVADHLKANYYTNKQVDKMIGTIDKKADKAIEKSTLALGGVANAVAMANLVQVNSYSRHRHNLSAAYGYYGGSHALAIGFSGTNKERNFVYKLSGSVNNQGNLALGLGAGIMLGEVHDEYPDNTVNSKKLALVTKKLDEANDKIAKYETRQKETDKKLKELNDYKENTEKRMKDLEKKLELLMKKGK